MKSTKMTRRPDNMGESRAFGLNRPVPPKRLEELTCLLDIAYKSRKLVNLIKKKSLFR